MKASLRFWSGVAALLGVLPSSAQPAAAPAPALPPPAPRLVQFKQDVQPVLETRCMHCHGRGRDKGGLQMDNRELLLRGGDSGPAIIPGKSDESLLIQLVASTDPVTVMPRKGKPLTPAQIGVLRAWIDQGAPWDADVSFARHEPQNLHPRRPELPPASAGATNPVDRLLASYSQTNRFTPPPVVADRVFARRAYLTTIGLLPGPAELVAFEQDSSPDKRAQLVRRLLADDQRYAEHWLTFWNDHLRNDYRGTGYIDGGRKQITAWLFGALKTNLPYDQFVAQLVTASPGTEGFTKGIIWRGVVNSSQTPPMQAAQNVSQVFMGVNLKCASCHDSFINEWRLADAYGLASVYHDGPMEMFQCDKPTGQTASPRFIYAELGELDAQADKPARLKQLAEIMTSSKNGRLSRALVNRLWAQVFGRGLVEPLDDMDQPSWNPALLDWLAEDFVASGYNVRHVLEVLLTSQASQLPAVDLGESPAKEFVFHGPAVRRLTAEQFRDAVAQVTGQWCGKAELKVATNDVRASLVAADPLATALGRPNREQVTTVRPSVATTLQALELTNGKTLAQILDHAASEMATAHPDPAELANQVCLTALGRKASAAETQAARELVGQPVSKEGVADLLWAVVVLPEFQLIY
jgi:mono/diheme cytochrome c family protein